LAIKAVQLLVSDVQIGTLTLSFSSSSTLSLHMVGHFLAVSAPLLVSVAFHSMTLFGW